MKFIFSAVVSSIVALVSSPVAFAFDATYDFSGSSTSAVVTGSDSQYLYAGNFTPQGGWAYISISDWPLRGAAIGTSGTGSDLAAALADDDYLSLTLAAQPLGTLDLESLLLDFGGIAGLPGQSNWNPHTTNLVVQSSVGGFGPGQPTLVVSPASLSIPATATSTLTAAVVDVSGPDFDGLSEVTFQFRVFDSINSGGNTNYVDNVVVTGTALSSGLNPLDIEVVGNYVATSVVQRDGKIIVAGKFSSVLGVPRQNIARINVDGSLDTGFDPKTNNTVNCVAVQKDGKVLLGGAFTTLQPNGAGSTTARNRIARLNADGTLDPDFDPSADDQVHLLTEQADGKILLGGRFTSLQPSGSVSPTTRNRIARLNADGTLDMGFDPNANNSIYGAAIQEDGRIVLGGLFTSFQPNGAAASTTRNRMARLNADGTLDPHFDPNVNNAVFSVALQSDGRVLLGGWFTTLRPNGAASPTSRQYIARLNANGTLDADLNPRPNSYVYSMAMQSDGKIIFGGDFTNVQPIGSPLTTRNHLARLNADGSLDSDFRPNADNNVRSVTLQDEGKVLVGGFFTSIQPTGAPNPAARNLFARLDNDPAALSLNVPNTSEVVWIRGGSAPELSQVTFELSVDGGVSYTPLAGPATRLGGAPSWHLTGLSLPANGWIRACGRTSGGLYCGSSGLVEAVGEFIGISDPLPGDLDTLDASLVSNTGSAIVFASVVQADGRTIIAGSFDSVFGVSRENIARLNADGTLDMGFDPRAGGTVHCVVVQEDGKILLGGQFTALWPSGGGAGLARHFIGRLNADGTLDASYDPKPNHVVACMSLQVDGKILIGGWFANFSPNGATTPLAQSHIARLNTDGTLDMGFDPPAPNSYVYTLAVQEDGNILLGGKFTSLTGGGPRQYIARLNVDGELDAGFDPRADDEVNCLALQADGKILVGGQFASLQPNGAATPTPRNFIACLNEDGTLDTAFDPNASGGINSMALQADGKILVGGHFISLQPNGAGAPTMRNFMARLNADGTVDSIFDPNVNGPVFSIGLQADGQILLGGDFTALQPNGAASPTGRIGFARLLNDPASQVLGATFTTQVSWTRGGSAPEISQVTVDVSSNGGTSWTPLGNASRTATTSNWQLAGLSLPESGMLRVRGLAAGGFSSGSSGRMEELLVYSNLVSPVSFGEALTTAGLSEDDAAPDATPFDDGVSNLLKYAFNMNLASADAHAMAIGGASGLPGGGLVEDGGQTYWRVQYVRRIGSGLIYTPKKSTTLLPDSFVPMIGAGSEEVIDAEWVRVTVDEPCNPLATPTCFSHVEVTLP